jgi:hypothetical protein
MQWTSEWNLHGNGLVSGGCRQGLGAEVDSKSSKKKLYFSQHWMRKKSLTSFFPTKINVFEIWHPPILGHNTKGTKASLCLHGEKGKDTEEKICIGHPFLRPAPQKSICIENSLPGRSSTPNGCGTPRRRRWRSAPRPRRRP